MTSWQKMYFLLYSSLFNKTFEEMNCNGTSATHRYRGGRYRWAFYRLFAFNTGYTKCNYPGTRSRRSRTLKFAWLFAPATLRIWTWCVLFKHGQIKPQTLEAPWTSSWAHTLHTNRPTHAWKWWWWYVHTVELPCCTRIGATCRRAFQRSLRTALSPI